MQSIYFLRHGHSTLTGKYVGSTDCPLSQLGHSQVRALAMAHPFASVSHIISSPMRRCVETYQGLNMNVKVQHEENLREIDFGLWEGLDFQEVYSVFRSEFESWCADPQGFCFPSGESVADFQSRLATMPEYLKSCDGDILVVAHGGVIRHLLCLLLELPPTRAMKLQIDVAHYAQVSVFDGDCVLNTLNHG